jgi:hypothetical protein
MNHPERIRKRNYTVLHKYLFLKKKRYLGIPPSGEILSRTPELECRDMGVPLAVQSFSGENTH